MEKYRDFRVSELLPNLRPQFQRFGGGNVDAAVCEAPSPLVYIY